MIGIEFDFQKFFQYEMPGVLILVYILLFSNPLVLKLIKQTESFPIWLIENLSGIAISTVIFALPLGYLAFNLYYHQKWVRYIEKRVGYDIIEFKLKSDSPEEKWWKEQNSEIKNEILDVIFYTEKSNLTKTLGSFITQFHSLHVIRYYAPFVALVVSLFLLVIAYCLSYITWSFIQSYISCSLILWVISVLIFLCFSELILKKNIETIKKIKDEIEANIVLMRTDKALRAIKRRMEIDDLMKKRRKN